MHLSTKRKQIPVVMQTQWLRTSSLLCNQEGRQGRTSELFKEQSLLLGRDKLNSLHHFQHSSAAPEHPCPVVFKEQNPDYRCSQAIYNGLYLPALPIMGNRPVAKAVATPLFLDSLRKTLS